MSVIWYKVWSDLWDNKVRTALAVLSISVGVFAVGATFGMSDQMLAGMDEAHRASVPAHFTISVTENIPGLHHPRPQRHRHQRAG